jgi:hypothetical protein
LDGLHILSHNIFSVEKGFGPKSQHFTAITIQEPLKKFTIVKSSGEAVRPLVLNFSLKK